MNSIIKNVTNNLILFIISHANHHHCRHILEMSVQTTHHLYVSVSQPPHQTPINSNSSSFQVLLVTFIKYIHAYSIKAYTKVCFIGEGYGRQFLLSLSLDTCQENPAIAHNQTMKSFSYVQEMFFSFLEETAWKETGAFKIYTRHKVQCSIRMTFLSSDVFCFTYLKVQTC